MNTDEIAERLCEDLGIDVATLEGDTSKILILRAMQEAYLLGTDDGIKQASDELNEVITRLRQHIEEAQEKAWKFREIADRHWNKMPLAALSGNEADAVKRQLLRAIQEATEWQAGEIVKLEDMVLQLRQQLEEARQRHIEHSTQLRQQLKETLDQLHAANDRLTQLEQDKLEQDEAYKFGYRTAVKDCGCDSIGSLPQEIEEHKVRAEDTPA